jgi:hypothetical protein
MNDKPKPTDSGFYNKLGPIPAEHFDNDWDPPSDNPTPAQQHMRDLADEAVRQALPEQSSGASKARYGAFESNPARFTDEEAWVFDGRDWKQFNPAEVQMHAALLTEATYQREFGELPPLPPEAFSAA